MRETELIIKGYKKFRIQTDSKFDWYPLEIIAKTKSEAIKIIKNSHEVDVKIKSIRQCEILEGKEYILKISDRMYIATGMDGDPPRTYLLSSARKFKSIRAVKRMITKCKKEYPYRDLDYEIQIYTKKEM